MRDPLRWPSLIVASTVAVAALLLADAHSPLRVVVTLWFLLVCTGMAFVPLLEIRPRAFELALGVVLSILLDALVAAALVLANGLSAANGLIALAVICLIGCTLQVLMLPPWRSSTRSASRTDASGAPAPRASHL
jgi:hypothetical protein